MRKLSVVFVALALVVGFSVNAMAAQALFYSEKERLAVAPTKELEVSIRPVPNDGNFTVQMISQQEEIWSMTIYDAMGSQVYESKNINVSGTTERFINLKPAKNGFYSMLLRSGDKMILKKFIIIN